MKDNRPIPILNNMPMMYPTKTPKQPNNNPPATAARMISIQVGKCSVNVIAAALTVANFFPDAGIASGEMELSCCRSSFETAPYIFRYDAIPSLSSSDID